MAVPRAEDSRRMIEKADVLIDNFSSARWRRGFATLVRPARARLVRCSITATDRAAPRRRCRLTTFILQARIRADEHFAARPDGGPTKYGVAIVDVCTGMLSCSSILAALNARQRTGKGQKVELSLYETSLAMLINVASNYLTPAATGGRFGNGHPSIVPYTTYQAADGMMAIGIGNERAICALRRGARHPEWATDERFASNRARSRHRAAIDGLINEALARDERRPPWLAKLMAVGIPCGKDQLGRRGARRSAHRRARHDRDGRACHHRRLEDARDSVQVLRHRLLGAPRTADARPAQRRDPQRRARARREGDRRAARGESHLSGD
jgi:crotonobetainyl-CoA:carnitine CoA-transferase CaiB-like acyl-CoA transferase